MVFVETNQINFDQATKDKVKSFVDSLTGEKVTAYPISEQAALLMIKFLIESNATKQAVQYAFRLVHEHPTISKKNGVWALLFAFMHQLRNSSTAMRKGHNLP
jgi:hypothetical protein